MAWVLVVEDEETVGKVMELCLTRAGHAVVRAECGLCALETLRKQPFDVVLTDILMPGKDGIEFIRDARRLYPNMPLVVVSGGGESQNQPYMKVARLMGATATLSKPFTSAQLARTVEQVLNQTPP